MLLIDWVERAGDFNFALDAIATNDVTYEYF